MEYFDLRKFLFGLKLIIISKKSLFFNRSEIGGVKKERFACSFKQRLWCQSYDWAVDSHVHNVKLSRL